MLRKLIEAFFIALGVAPPIILIVALIQNWNTTRTVHDFVEFYAAARIIATGNNPYGPVEQSLVQQSIIRQYGETEKNGVGFQAYYYPPWLALATIPLLPLGYDLGRAVWAALNLLSLAGAGFMLSGRASVPSRAASIIAVLAFMPSIIAIWIGQTTPLVLVLAVATSRLLEARRDRSAGIALACLTFKPQLVVILIPAMLLWSARRQRWVVIWTWALTMGLFCALSTLALPSWPYDMYRALTTIPRPAAIHHVTWPACLSVAGLTGWAWGLAYVGLMVPAALIALRAAWDRSRGPSAALSTGLLAAFYASPHALLYDLTVISAPLILVSARLRSAKAISATLTLFLAWSYVVPTAHFVLSQGRLMPFLNFSIPALVSTLWLVLDRRKQAG